MKFATATSNVPSGKGRSCTSATRASTPRARVSSTIRSDWSHATTSSPAWRRRSASSPRPQPTSSTRRGAAASTASSATSCARGPDRLAQIEVRAASPASSAYSRRTTFGSSCARGRSATRAGARLLVRGDLLADLLERAANQARDMHLRDPDLLCDLRLRQTVEEPELENHPLAVVERTEAGREHGAVLGDLVLVLLAADRLERIERVVAFPAAAGREREGRVRATRFERLEHLFLGRAGRLRELRDRRRAAELHGQLLHQARELHVQLLQPARHAHSPALVAEMTLDLADDVRRRVRRQLDAALEIEPVDRLDQPDRADLDEILELFATVRVAPRERPHERHVLLDQLLARMQVALFVVLAQEDLVVDARHYATRAFVMATQTAPSRSSTRSVSVTVSRTRRSPSPLPSPSSSASCWRTNGPTVA